MARFPGKPQPHQITEKMSISNQESQGGITVTKEGQESRLMVPPCIGSLLL